MLALGGRFRLRRGVRSEVDGRRDGRAVHVGTGRRLIPPAGRDHRLRESVPRADRRALVRLAGTVVVHHVLTSTFPFTPAVTTLTFDMVMDSRVNTACSFRGNAVPGIW